MSVPPRTPDSPISLSRFNLKPVPSRTREIWLFGKIRAFSTFSKLEWAYLIISLTALTVSLGITIQRLTVEEPDESDFTFAVLLLITIVFCYHYVVHSMFTERWDELMVFVVSSIIVLVYCIVNFVKHPDGADQPLIKLIRLIIVCILSPFLIIVGCIQSYKYLKSNNLIFDTVGAFSTLHDACRLFHICVSLLKFDLQMQISMLILFMGQGVVNLNLEQKIILASGVPITFLFIILGYLGLRFENIPLMIAFYILGLLEPACVVYKFYYTASFQQNNGATYDSTFACGYFALVIWVLLVLCTLYYMKSYFGKGLKEKMFGDTTKETETTNRSTSRNRDSETESS